MVTALRKRSEKLVSFLGDGEVHIYAVSEANMDPFTGIAETDPHMPRGNRFVRRPLNQAIRTGTALLRRFEGEGGM